MCFSTLNKQCITLQVNVPYMHAVFIDHTKYSVYMDYVASLHLLGSKRRHILLLLLDVLNRELQ